MCNVTKNIIIEVSTSELISGEKSGENFSFTNCCNHVKGTVGNPLIPTFFGGPYGSNFELFQKIIA